MTDYTAFLREKIKLAQFKGFKVAAAEVNPHVKPHTRDIVRWACLGGQRAEERAFSMPTLFDFEELEAA